MGARIRFLAQGQGNPQNHPMLPRIRFSVDHAWGSWKIDVHGGSSQALTGEIGLLKIQIVFAEVSICPGTIKLLRKSSRETHFAATATCFEYSTESQGSPRGAPGNPFRNPWKTQGTLRRWGSGPQTPVSKHGLESTWGAFLSSRLTF